MSYWFARITPHPLAADPLVIVRFGSLHGYVVELKEAY